MQLASPHNRPGTSILAGLLILVLVLPAGGCRRDDEVADTPAVRVPTSAPADPARARPVAASPAPSPADLGDAATSIDISAARGWLVLARRLAAGERPTLADFTRLYDLPGFAHAYDDPFGPRALRPGNLKRLTDYLFLGRKAAGGRQPKRQDVLHNLEYLRPRLARLDTFLTELAGSDLARRSLAMAAPWLPPGNVPRSLTVRLFVGPPSIRYWEPDHEMIVDAGLALASGRQQLARLVAANLYRYHAPVLGPRPEEASSGDRALAAAFDELRRQGIAAWIERLPDLSFDPAHPDLGDPNRRHSDPVAEAAGWLPTVFDMLDGLLGQDDRQLLAQRGRSLGDYLRIGGRAPVLGYAMAALIDDRLGPATLQACCNDPVAFVARYQQAATDGGATGRLSLLKPFPAEIYHRLERLLREIYPSTGGNSR